jgi:hypothetical protein
VTNQLSIFNPSKFYQSEKSAKDWKAAKNLFKKKDDWITEYEKQPLLKILANCAYHFSEVSETENKRNWNCHKYIWHYDLSWRSNKVIYFDIPYFTKMKKNCIFSRILIFYWFFTYLVKKLIKRSAWYTCKR